MDKAMLGKGAFATPSEMVKEVIMDFGEVSDEVFILESYAVEGIPVEALIWTWPSGEEAIYELHYGNAMHTIFMQGER